MSINGLILQQAADLLLPIWCCFYRIFRPMIFSNSLLRGRTLCGTNSSSGRVALCFTQEGHSM